jgi:chromosome segregation ATPase
VSTIDESVVNLQRFLGQLAQATGALEQVGTHVQESAERLSQLEDQASDDGGGLNDELSELDSALETGRDDVREAIAEVTQAAADAEEAAEEDRARVEQAAADLEATVGDTMEELGDAHSSVTDQGFQPLLQALDEAEQELGAQRQELQQEMDALEGAIHAAETESRTAWDEVDGALGEGISALAQSEGSLQSEASEGIQGFATAGDELEAECSTLESEIDTIYDVLDASVAAQGEEWEQGLQEDAREALEHVTTGSDERLEQPARVVEEEGLASLGHEYDDLGVVLGAAVATGDEVEPLSVELAKCSAVIGQVDELLNSLAG